MGNLKEIVQKELRNTIKEPARVLNILNKKMLFEHLKLLYLKFTYLGSKGKYAPETLVEKGYDRIANQYTIWTSTSQIGQRKKTVDTLLETMPQTIDVLDLGCGTGIPVTKSLAEKFAVTGVDISTRNIEMAKENIPNGRFIKSNMKNVELDRESFDVVTAFYSIVHLPRDEHHVVLRKMTATLRPGGIAIVTMGSRSIENLIEVDWMGAPMYWSMFDDKTNIGLIEDAGLTILAKEQIEEEALGRTNTFFWIVAQKPFQEDSPLTKKITEFVEAMG